MKPPSDPSDRASSAPGSAAVLVVAAWDPELERFRALAREPLAFGVQIQAVGIGPVDTAALVTRCILQHHPELVVLLGTCGAAPDSGLGIGDVIVGTSVRLVDPSVVAARAAMPYAEAAIALDAEMQPALVAAGARPASIANTLGITTDDTLATALAPLGAVEHLEAYGVARACQLASVRCAVVLGVANEVGARGREDWRANHVEVSARAASVAWDALVRTSTTRRSPV
jgi:nucleoside phosphorylase